MRELRVHQLLFLNEKNENTLKFYSRLISTHDTSMNNPPALIRTDETPHAPPQAAAQPVQTRAPQKQTHSPNKKNPQPRSPPPPKPLVLEFGTQTIVEQPAIDKEKEISDFMQTILDNRNLQKEKYIKKYNKIIAKVLTQKILIRHFSQSSKSYNVEIKLPRVDLHDIDILLRECLDDTLAENDDIKIEYTYRKKCKKYQRVKLYVYLTRVIA